MASAVCCPCCSRRCALQVFRPCGSSCRVVGVCEVTFCCDGAADQAGWYCERGGHALYDVALNLVFLGLQYVTPGESVASRTRSKKSA